MNGKKRGKESQKFKNVKERKNSKYKTVKNGKKEVNNVK